MTMQRIPSGQSEPPAGASSPNGVTQATVAASVKEIPYDYVATFKLEGRAGNRVQDVINISVDGAFVAVAVGYSFVIVAPPSLTRDQRDALADAWPDRATDELHNIRPVTRFTAAMTAAIGQLRSVSKDILWLRFVASLFEGVDPAIIKRGLISRLCGIEFKYSIIDSGTGRELQNKPIHNIAGLGESGGIRPFRPLAKPMLFMPRSTIRIEIEEILEGPPYVNAELFIVLHGYKLLGYGTALP